MIQIMGSARSPAYDGEKEVHVMKTILVPLDGSALAQQALPHALALARREDAELVLLGVDEQYIYFTETEHLTTYLGGLCDRIRAAGWRVRWEVMAGGPAELIVQRAEQVKADLIVMSSHGRRGVTRWVLGSVTERVGRETPCALMVVRCPQGVSAGQAEYALGTALAGELPGYERVLVPLDGSLVSEGAVGLASQLAGRSLSLMGVLDFPTPIFGGELPSGWAADVGRQNEAERLRYLDGVAGRLRASELEVDTFMRRGSAADEIVEASERADLLVMTTCSRPWLERAVTGSVASRVLRHSACPVLVLPGLPVPVAT